MICGLKDCCFVVGSCGNIKIFDFFESKVNGNGYNSYTTKFVRRFDCFIYDMRQAFWGHHRSIVDTDIRKHWIFVHFLKVIIVHRGGGDLSKQSDHRHVVHLGIIQTIDQMGRSRTSRAKDSTDFASQLRICCCGQCACFFMADLNILDTLPFMEQSIHG